jgi:RNA polymerase sigma-70 factor (ECF subfamily)
VNTADNVYGESGFEDMTRQLTTEERAAFAEMLKPHHEYLARFCNRLRRSDEDGRDLYQQAILKALVKLDSLKNRNRFRQWLCSIIVNEHRSCCRRERLRRLIGLSPQHQGTANSPDPDRIIRLRQCLQRLTPAKREAVVLFEVEGFTIEEIAEIQRISATAAKTRVSRARRELKELFPGDRPRPGTPRARQVNGHGYRTRLDTIEKAHR